MIRSEAEFRRAMRDLHLAEVLLEDERTHWLDEGMTEAEASQMTDPLRLRIADLRDRIGEFERVQAGDLSMFGRIEDLGQALIAARIARGLSQRQLAELLGVHESQVSRDERNEYHGVGRERLGELMDTLGLRFQGAFHLGDLVVHPRLVPIQQPMVFLQAAGLPLDPEEIERELRDAVA